MFPVLATLRLSWHRSRFKHGWSGQGRHVTLRRQSDKARGMGDTAKVFTLEEQRMNSSRMMWVRLITERPPAKTTERKRYTPGKRPTWNLMAWTRLEDYCPLQTISGSMLIFQSVNMNSQNGRGATFGHRSSLRPASCADSQPSMLNSP